MERESDTYLAIVGRHLSSSWITIKMKYRSFQPALQISSSKIFHRNPRTPTMSTDNSQVGVALSPY